MDGIWREGDMEREKVREGGRVGGIEEERVLKNRGERVHVRSHKHFADTSKTIIYHN